MGAKTQLAKLMRASGLGGLVDSPSFRRLAGAPLYRQHKGEPKPGGAAGSPVVRSGGVRDVPQMVATDVSDKPLVTVIVPAYNVEDYLIDSVGTLLEQSYNNLEIVIVDDGSADSTPRLCDGIARRDSRVKVVHKRNGGLGAARNTGLDHATGEYITFFDSDDQLTPHAIEVLLASLEETGSDFSIGAVERYTSTTIWTPFWVTLVHSKVQSGVQAKDFPEVLWDNIVCNKLFKRSSWEKYVGRFPEGVLYEDQECTAKLFSLGAKFDVLADVTYRWYRRDNLSSISQQKHTVGDLESRIGVAKKVQEVFAESGETSLSDYYATKLLGDDFYTYCEQVPRAEDGFYKILRDGTRDLLAHSSDKAVADIAFDRRQVILSLAEMDREAFESALMQLQNWGRSWITELAEDGQLVGKILDLEFQGELGEISTLVSPDSLEPRVEFSGQTFDAEGNVEFTGFAFIPTVSDFQLTELEMTLVRFGEDDEWIDQIDLSPVWVDSLWADIAATDSYNSHKRNGFRVSLPIEVIEAATADADPATQSQQWIFVTTIKLGRNSWSAKKVDVRLNGSGGNLQPTQLTSSGKRLAFEHKSGVFKAIPISTRFSLQGANITDNNLELSFRASRFISDRYSRIDGEFEVKIHSDGALACQAVCVRAVTADSDEWTATIDLTEWSSLTNANSRIGEIVVTAPRGLRAPIAVERHLDLELSDSLFCLESSSFGFLRIRQIAQFATVDEVVLAEDGRSITCTGNCVFDSDRVRQRTPSFALVGPKVNIHPSEFDWDAAERRYRVTFSLYTEDLRGREVMFPADDYTLQVLQASGKRLPASVWVTCSGPLTRQLPMETRNSRTSLRLSRKIKQGGLGIAILRTSSQRDTSKYLQHELFKKFFTGVRKLEDAALFESFNGQTVSDSPKALDAIVANEAPQIKRYWSVRDGSIAVPDGAIPVVMYTEEWFRILSSARFLVNNNNFPHFFRKDPEQVYIQTWHGTPLKKIGNDVPPQNLSLVYRGLMKREAEKYWDFLLAQSDWASDVLKSSFGFPGEPLSLGYPRNDALFSSSAVEVRNAVRRSLGITRNQSVVLYAPTWRDNVRGKNGQYVQPEFLDIPALRKALGNDVVVMVRAHANTRENPLSLSGVGVINVSDYPDVNDLYLAADSLVTDYSSVMFDFVNTMKPIYFLAPDITEYRDTTRGFYFDFESSAPGPIVGTTKELIAAMRTHGSHLLGRHQKYDAFVQKFAPLDDGSAAERVFQATFGSKLSASSHRNRKNVASPK